jgi:hypothetical protein
VAHGSSSVPYLVLYNHATNDTGSGESIRGNINSFVDNLGNSTAQNSGSSGTHPGLQGSGGSMKDAERDVENHATAAQGKEEMQSGLNAFQK